MRINPVSQSSTLAGTLTSQLVSGATPATVIPCSTNLNHRRSMPSATPLCHRWAKTNGKPVDQYSSTMQSGIFAVRLRKESSHPGFTGIARTWRNSSFLMQPSLPWYFICFYKYILELHNFGWYYRRAISVALQSS